MMYTIKICENHQYKYVADVAFSRYNDNSILGIRLSEFESHIELTSSQLISLVHFLSSGEFSHIYKYTDWLNDEEIAGNMILSNIYRYFIIDPVIESNVIS